MTGGFVTVIDAADAPLILAINRRWWVVKNRTKRGDLFYAACKPEKNRTLYLHKVLMGPPPAPGLKVDHIDHNGLNNRRSNLRWASPSESLQNRRAWGVSGIKGAYRSGSVWLARVHFQGRQIDLGRYASKADAGRAYDAFAREYYGAFAILNFPDEVPA